MMIRNLFTLLLFMGSGFGLSAQNLDASRPDRTPSANTVGHKSFQIDAGLLFGDLNNESQRVYMLPRTLFRYGLTKGIELRVGEDLVNYVSESTSDPKFGLSDLELGVKFRILNKEDINAKIAFISHVLLPTGTGGLSLEKYGTKNTLALSHELNSFTHLGYSVGYNYYGYSKGVLTYGLVLGAAFNEKFGAFLEFYGEDVDFSNFLINFDGGLYFLLKENLQLDFAFALGLNHRMNYFTTGICWNIGGKKE